MDKRHSIIVVNFVDVGMGLMRMQDFLLIEFVLLMVEGVVSCRVGLGLDIVGNILYFNIFGVVLLRG